MNIPADLLYTDDHEWVKIEGGIATVGITDFAQGQLGDIVFLDINTLGENLQHGAVFGSIEAVKTVSDLFIPISGEVSDINDLLESKPELVNSDPYGKGWIIKVKVAAEADTSHLLDSGKYEAHVAKVQG